MPVYVRSLVRAYPATVVGAVVLAISLGGWLALVTSRWYVERRLPEPVDLSVYRGAAASLAWAPDQLYSQGFGVAALPFVYPPFSALVFSLFDGVGAGAMAAAMSAVSLVALAGAIWASQGMLGERRTWRRLGICMAVAGVALWLEPVQQDLDFGQVNLILLGVVMADMGQGDERWWKGVGVGLAAGFKLTALLLIVYLLVTGRFRAAVVAGGTFAATVALGWVMLPGASAVFWTRSVATQANTLDYLGNQSLYGMFLRLNDNAVGPATGCWVVACVVVVVPGLRAARAACRRGQELLAVCVTVALMVLVSPISWTHHWVWLIPGLVLVADRVLRPSEGGGHGAGCGGGGGGGRGRARVWTAALLVGLAAWPMRIDPFGAWDARQPLLPTGLIWYVPHRDGREVWWDPFQVLAGNSYVLLGVGFVVWAAWTLLREAGPGASRMVPEPTRALDAGRRGDQALLDQE